MPDAQCPTLSIEHSALSTGPCTYNPRLHAILANDRENQYYDAPDSNGSGTGRATVTSLTDAYVEGTFSFDGRSRINGTSKSVTSGTFRIKLEDRRIC
jgi:hypothetical protein